MPVCDLYNDSDFKQTEMGVVWAKLLGLGLKCSQEMAKLSFLLEHFQTFWETPWLCVEKKRFN